MRKLCYYFTPSAWRLLGLALFIIILAIVIIDCATLSLKAPTTQTLIKTVAYEAGYEIAIKNPDLAKEITQYTEPGRKDILTYWLSWKNYLAYRIKDRFLRLGVQTLISSVEVDLQVKAPEDRIELIRSVLDGFKKGLEAGIDAKN